MIVLIPLNILIVKRMRALSTENMKFKDKRIKLMNEILNGIKARGFAVVVFTLFLLDCMSKLVGHQKT